MSCSEVTALLELHNIMNRYEIDSCGFGLLVDFNNHPSHTLVETALMGLSRLTHRGACGEDGLSGDGCGLMLQLDHHFYASLATQQGIAVEPPFAVGMCFLNKEEHEANKAALEHQLKKQGFAIGGWRNVPVNFSYAGKNSQKNMPSFAQIFVQYPPEWPIALVEKKLYIAKLLAHHALQDDPYFNVCSLSTQTIVYKALVLTSNLPLFYPDLQNKNLKSAVAMFHQRFSTNTRTAWNLAQPFSILAHNGEFNTIQGNRHYAQQLSHHLIRDYFAELQELPTLINVKGSDSLSLDNLLEAFIQTGFLSYEALRLIIPPAWENDHEMSREVKDYYRFHAAHLPPWEGPAGIVFFDGRFAGCILDRNGFRPARIVRGNNNWIGIGSELGLFDLENEGALELSRMQPGELFLIDLQQEKLISPEDYINELYHKHPYSEWDSKSLESIESRDIIKMHDVITDEVYKRFDVSIDEKEHVLRYMGEYGIEPTSSMGDDTPMAALSVKPRQLFDFFRQQFAQVTNPPVDSLRETAILSLQTYFGTRGLITQRNANFAQQLRFPSPLLSQYQRHYISDLDPKSFQLTELPLTYSAELELEEALDNFVNQTANLLMDTHHILVLTDERWQVNQCSIHPMLAVGALHHALINKHQREKVSLVVHSGWVREPHHLAMLVACGAEAVYPWLAYQLIIDLAIKNQQSPLFALNNYRQALNKGLLKICSKMGICTINSYKGSQLFHVIGLDQQIILRCFSQSNYWLEKLDWQALDAQQKQFYYHSVNENLPIRQGGLYKYTPQGEYHDYNPDVVTSLLRAVNENNPIYYQQFKELLNYRPPVMVRDFLQLNSDKPPIPRKDVEPISGILKRFDTAAMSLGALSPEAHEALAVAMNSLGGRSNSGEGGEAKYRQNTLKQSKIKQVASGRFGVTAEYLMHAEVIQIKIAQGAKPGEGGQLPGNKVNAMIAELRYSSPGVTLISPPPHHDIYSIEDLAQLIFDLKQINPRAFISVKLVSAPGVGTIAAGVVKAYADMITISGYDGGTGASPLSSIRYTGCPWELGLSEAQNILLHHNLRHRVTLQIDGGLKTGLDVVKAALLGAESFGFGTAPMITLGCKYLRICHLNNCATGIATQDERLRTELYSGLPERVMLYFQWIAEEVREILALMGYQRLQDIIGRVDLLQTISQLEKSQQTSLNKLLYRVVPGKKYAKKLYLQTANPPFDNALLAKKLATDVFPAIEKHSDYKKRYQISNKDRSIGANIAGAIAERYGNKGFKALLEFEFNGIAGQSFGAWMVQGMALHLHGAANDYVAKGMNGGELVITPFTGSSLDPSRVSIAGNTCLYGATGGVCLLNGLAGERFAVRNSGACAVVLGVGNHGCEYMTGGLVVILGTPGSNFAAGMTGGMAFVYDKEHKLSLRFNKESVQIYNLNNPDFKAYQEQFTDFLQYFYDKTQNSLAAMLLHDPETYWSDLYMVLPVNKPPTPSFPTKEAS